MLTPEMAADYFGVDLRSTREWMRDGMTTLSRALRSRSLRPPPPSPPDPTTATNAATIPPPTTSTANTSTVNLEKPHKTLAVGVMIAMPNPSRPRYLTSSSSSIALTPQASSSSDIDDRPTPTPPSPQRPLLEPSQQDLPEIALGVIESDWTGRPFMPPAKPPPPPPPPTRRMYRGRYVSPEQERREAIQIMMIRETML